MVQNNMASCPMTNSQSFAVNDDENLPEAVCKTQEAVAVLAENFTEWMRAVLDAAYALLTKAKDPQPDNAAIGPSSTPSATTSRIRRFVRLRPDFASWQITVRLQLRRRIHVRDIQGDGGQVGKQLQTICGAAPKRPSDVKFSPAIDAPRSPFRRLHHHC